MNPEDYYIPRPSGTGGTLSGGGGGGGSEGASVPPKVLLMCPFLLMSPNQNHEQQVKIKLNTLKRSSFFV